VPELDLISASSPGAVELCDPPRLLVEWSSPWQEFKTAFRPALARPPRALAGEAHFRMFPYRGMLLSWILECLALVAVIVLPARIASLQPFTPPPRPTWDVIYYSGEELPQTADRGGAEAGKSGRAGGKQAHHRSQIIRIARGDKPSEKIVDAPRIKLPHSDSAVANLLAFKSIPGPAPAEGLPSSHNSRSLSPNSSPVPPSPQVQSSLRNSSALATTVVGPAQAPRDLSSSRAPLNQPTEVVAPPVSAPQRDLSSAAKLTLPSPSVVAPPPSDVNRELDSWGSTRAGDLRSQPVPPPPSASASSLSASGRGNKGNGSGGSLDFGSSVAPPASGGNAPGNGLVVSTQPGSKVGLPNSTGAGAIAMSPSGTSTTGLGGSGGGSGIGRGSGSGSGFSGEGSGAAKSGSGRGSDTSARGGISPYPGSGGAGSGTRGSPAIPGVSVEGGSTTVTLPSFGPPNGEAQNGPGRSSTNQHTGSGITIEATPRSGGVFAYYGVLKGDRNYSIYIQTSIGTAVMQYADPASAAHPSNEPLTAPEPMHKELPANLRPTRVIVACILNRSGELRNVKVLEPGAAESTSKILVALQSWKFRPAFRGNEPVEVNAILGFGVDTR